MDQSCGCRVWLLLGRLKSASPTPYAPAATAKSLHLRVDAAYATVWLLIQHPTSPLQIHMHVRSLTSFSVFSETTQHLQWFTIHSCRLCENFKVAPDVCFIRYTKLKSILSFWPYTATCLLDKELYGISWDSLSNIQETTAWWMCGLTKNSLRMSERFIQFGKAFVMKLAW